MIGAGVGGTLLAICLAKLGCKVEIFEKRSDIRKIPPNSDRSINQSLSLRGRKILEEFGLWKTVQKLTLIEKGRTVHNLDGSTFFSPYGKNEKEVHESFNRNSFNGVLLNIAQAYPEIEIHFNVICQNLDFHRRIANFRNSRNGRLFQKKFDILVGADGVNSAVRREIENNTGKVSEKRYLGWGYKNAYMPASEELNRFLRNDTFHIWPREDSTLLAIANINGSFTSTLIAPFEKDGSISSLKTKEEVDQLFKKNFMDVVSHIPYLSKNFYENKTGRFVSIYTDSWHFRDCVVLLGDSCHAVMPFYSQGVSATLEDVKSLYSQIKKFYPNWQIIFEHYQKERKKNTDILAILSENRFYQLKDNFRSPIFIFKQKAEIVLTHLFPFWWVPLYTLISHTSIPYSEALKRYNLQKLVLVILIIVTIITFLLLLSLIG